jgi:hypothetical protein
MVRVDDPTKWVDDWPLPGLRDSDRTKIKSQLLKAHAVAVELYRKDVFKAAPAAMNMAFTGVAKILHESRLLTPEILDTQLPLFIIDAARAGRWMFLDRWRDREDRGESLEVRTEIIPGYFGPPDLWSSYRNPEAHGLWERSIFEAETAHWKSELLDVEIASASPELRTVVNSIEVERRKKLLDEYKAATGGTSSRKIYEASNSGIHKPQFYEWLRGELSKSSATLIAFERFLREKKPPIPRD